MNRTGKILITVFCSLLGVLLLAALGGYLYYLAATAGVSLDGEKLTPKERCVTVYDCENQPLGLPVGGTALIGELPDYLPNAFVAVEDKRFYNHRGLDYKRMVKAAMKNIASLSFKEGASTISQQLIKNTHLSGEKTIGRKLKEIKLTRALEREYSKREILERYLNSIYFGHSAFGLFDAARYYFGKPPAELTPAESATLAALVRSPNRYSPFKDAEKCLARRNFVLSLMAEQGYLTQSEAASAQQEPLPQEPHEAELSPYLTLVFDELSALVPDAGSGERLEVYTDLDQSLQHTLEELTCDSDAVTLVRDVKTDGIKAFFSTCGLLKRLPASTVKPLAVYGPALEENLISPATPLKNEKTDFGGYSPSNYGDEYGGFVSARYALAHSVNVPAVELLNSLGTGRAAGYLSRMGLAVKKEDETLALALGGMEEGYRLDRLCDGYATFPKGGVYSPSGAIRKVVRNGKTEYERTAERTSAADKFAAGGRIFSEETACLMNDMLKTAVREGTAKKLKRLPFEVCAKTGTGGTDRGNTDAYTIAYTTEDVVGVWMGNRDFSPIAATGGGLPANEALRILTALYADSAPAPFPLCGGVKEVFLDRDEYEKNHRLLLADPRAPKGTSFGELFREGTIPETASSRFSRPKIEKPLISVKNGAVRIILCQTEYYDYAVKRECEGQISVIYSGKYRKELFDNSVVGGKQYVYTVIPSYLGIEGEPVTLPAVTVEKAQGVPDDWWKD